MKLNFELKTIVFLFLILTFSYIIVTNFLYSKEGMENKETMDHSDEKDEEHKDEEHKDEEHKDEEHEDEKPKEGLTNCKKK
tara:strand:+ start:16243 stop:16485 length:243 start_codon:yes stop_codon:yes gene_type:complete